VYVVYNVVKYFRPYLLKSHTTIFVPHPTVRILLVQQELGEKRANCVTCLQEYDLEFKPIHTIKGHGLYKLVAKARDAPKKYL